jgi:hypothetical protein
MTSWFVRDVVVINAFCYERSMSDPETIYNWRRLDDRLTTSGQPTELQLAEIHALGVRHIVNIGLYTHEKALPDEAGSVSRLGMTYIHIPVDFENPAFDKLTPGNDCIIRCARSQKITAARARDRLESRVCARWQSRTQPPYLNGTQKAPPKIISGSCSPR